MKRLSTIITICLILTSGFTSAQSLITEIERDSIVSKIVRGNECVEKLQLANDVIQQADSVIYAQSNVIKSQKNLIEKYDKSILIYKGNEGNYKNIITNTKKKYKSKILPSFIKGLAIGVVVGVFIN